MWQRCGTDFLVLPRPSSRGPERRMPPTGSPPVQQARPEAWRTRTTAAATAGGNGGTATASPRSSGMPGERQFSWATKTWQVELARPSCRQIRPAAWKPWSLVGVIMACLATSSCSAADTTLSSTTANGPSPQPPTATSNSRTLQEDHRNRRSPNRGSRNDDHLRDRQQAIASTE